MCVLAGQRGRTSDAGGGAGHSAAIHNADIPRQPFRHRHGARRTLNVACIRATGAACDVCVVHWRRLHRLMHRCSPASMACASGANSSPREVSDRASSAGVQLRAAGGGGVCGRRTGGLRSRQLLHCGPTSAAATIESATPGAGCEVCVENAWWRGDEARVVAERGDKV